MQLKTKKIIAREGLIIFLGYSFCVIVWLFIAIVFIVDFQFKEMPIVLLMALISFGILYFVYWIIRFIIWSIETLKQKE